MEELVSVVIPSYNRKDTILKCMTSVQNQTYKNLEIIVVDDGSQDETELLFNAIQDPQVKFYRYEENHGACYARNYGAERAKGAYIAFQDSDDFWYPEKLEKQMNFLKAKNADFVFCGMNRVDPEGAFYYPHTDLDEYGNIVEQLLTDNVISTQTMLMKADVLNKVKFDITFRRFQDWDFAIQAAMAGFKICYLKEALLDSSVQKNSISVSANQARAYEHLFEKYRTEYEKFPHARATMYMYIARAYRGVDYKIVRRYLWLSLETEWNNKTFIKLALSYLGMWR